MAKSLNASASDTVRQISSAKRRRIKQGLFRKVVGIAAPLLPRRQRHGGGGPHRSVFCCDTGRRSIRDGQHQHDWRAAGRARHRVAGPVHEDSAVRAQTKARRTSSSEEAPQAQSVAATAVPVAQQSQKDDRVQALTQELTEARRTIEGLEAQLRAEPRRACNRSNGSARKRPSRRRRPRPRDRS